MPSGQQRRGDWMQTFTGGMFWPLDPRPEEVHADDIAHALSNLCRYAGHTRKFYSVAQHSCLVSDYVVSPEHALAGLLHDAAEAYLVDVPRPLKQSLPEYKAIEARVEAVIAERFGVPYPLPDEVKVVDLRMLATERRDLMPPCAVPWGALENVLPYPDGISSWSPEMAEREFHRRLRHNCVAECVLEW